MALSLLVRTGGGIDFGGHGLGRTCCLDLGECLPGPGMDGFEVGMLGQTADGGVDVAGIELDTAADAAGALGGDRENRGLAGDAGTG